MWCVGGIANSDDCVRGLLRFKRGRLRLGPQSVGGLPAVRSSFRAVSAARVVWALVFGMSVAAHPLSGAAAEPGYLFGAERSAQSDAFAQVGIDGWLREAVEQAVGKAIELSPEKWRVRESDGDVALRIAWPEEGDDPRASIARAVVEAGLDLLEIHEVQPTLDDVFLKAIDAQSLEASDEE